MGRSGGLERSGAGFEPTATPQPCQKKLRGTPGRLAATRTSGPRRRRNPVGTERRRVQAAIAARNRDQGRLRAITVAIGAASVLAGGAVAYALPGAATAASTSHGTTSHKGSGNSAGGTNSGSGTGTSPSGPSGSGSP